MPDVSKLCAWCHRAGATYERTRAGRTCWFHETCVLAWSRWRQINGEEATKQRSTP